MLRAEYQVECWVYDLVNRFGSIYHFLCVVFEPEKKIVCEYGKKASSTQKPFSCTGGVALTRFQYIIKSHMQLLAALQKHSRLTLQLVMDPCECYRVTFCIHKIPCASSRIQVQSEQFWGWKATAYEQNSCSLPKAVNSTVWAEGKGGGVKNFICSRIMFCGPSITGI